MLRTVTLGECFHGVVDAGPDEVDPAVSDLLLQPARRARADDFAGPGERRSFLLTTSQDGPTIALMSFTAAQLVPGWRRAGDIATPALAADTLAANYYVLRPTADSDA